LDLKILHSECCGISGTYGFKKEYYPISQEIGENLFKQINSINPDIVITDCETCKWQIEMNTSFEVVHPVTLLARSLF
jgi:glycerol-3-phosphate dehydrogenase subunit C